MRLRSALTMLLLGGLGLGLSACYYAPAPGYYDSGYYGSGYYGSGYYGSGYYYGGPSYYAGPAYYGPSVGVYYSGRWGGWDRDRRWH
ncbi:MAG TPA: hypothetical protein VKB68_16335 [Stellaceae bacterium]|nr:hypothetical protein [Stellaceae bacterium]